MNTLDHLSHSGTLNSSLYQQQLSLSHRVSTPNSANVTSTLLDGPESVGPACTSLYGGIDRDCCTLPNCWEHLTEFDRGCVKWCSNKAFVNRTEVMAGECRFMRGEGRAPIVLASLPGSGNTWIRGLLEKVTGICTGEPSHTLLSIAGLVCVMDHRVYILRCKLEACYVQWRGPEK